MSRLVLTPEANAAVLRNMKFGLGLVVGPLLLFLVVLAALINPPGSTEGFRIALLLVVFCLPILAMIGTCLVLAYPMDCWPGLLQTSKLTLYYGIKSDDMSNMGMLRWMKRGAFWMARAKGASVGFAFIAPWILLTWAIYGKFPGGFFFLAVAVIVFGGEMASKAWVVRQLVAERGEVVAATGEVSQQA